MQGVSLVNAGDALNAFALVPPLTEPQWIDVSSKPAPIALSSEANLRLILRQARSGRAVGLGVRGFLQSEGVSTRPPADGSFYAWMLTFRASMPQLELTEGGWATFEERVWGTLVWPNGRDNVVLRSSARAPQPTLEPGADVPRLKGAWAAWEQGTVYAWGGRAQHLRDLVHTAARAWALAAGKDPPDTLNDADYATALQRLEAVGRSREDLYALFAHALAPYYVEERGRQAEALGRWVAAFFPDLALVTPYAGGRMVWWVDGRALHPIGHSVAVTPNDSIFIVSTSRFTKYGQVQRVPRVLNRIQPEDLRKSTLWSWNETYGDDDFGDLFEEPGEGEETTTEETESSDFTDEDDPSPIPLEERQRSGARPSGGNWYEDKRDFLFQQD